MEDAGPLKEILDALAKPLRFASKDDFIHLNSLKSLEPLADSLISKALALSLSAEAKKRLAMLKDEFAGFDALDPHSKKERITAASVLLESLYGASAPETALITPVDAERSLRLLKTPLSHMKGVGPKLAERLAKKGLSTVEDILFFLPIRYEDRTRIKKIRELTPGLNEVTAAEVLALGEVYYGRRRVFEMAVGDGSAILKVKWFNFGRQMAKRYKQGQKLILFGQVGSFGAQKEMIHPDIEILGEDDSADHSGGIVPVYSQVENFHQKTIRKIVTNAVEEYASAVIGGAPQAVCAKAGFMPLPHAIKEAHIPSGSAQSAPAARKSIAFDELFLLEMGLALRRASIKKEAGIPFSPGGALESRLKGLLPFTLTRAQAKVSDEIKKDMAAPHPMNRLIQGDVGSGKTVVSLVAALTAIECGYQAALMAPTEILAEQHYLLTHRYADALGIKAALLTGNTPKSERKKMLEAVREGGVQLVIGTHALIQKDIEFKNLGLAVIDEQHRFGVIQRGILKKKGFGSDRGISPDILIMTATPIPRTLSMTVFGDLDVSIIDELPPGRKPVYTKLLKEKDRALAYSTIKRELEGGSQAYIVYPLVEESEEMDLRDATTMKEHLERDIFREWKVGLLHGRMKADEKESVMRDFKEKRLDILVSTTVIEVGVDVPNATVMLIEHAERFGLAQLHQLRGRVGRGEKKSICMLLAGWTNSEDTYRRLKVMEETNDGFRIAEEDLKIRGPGDFLGTRQAGLPDFRTEEALTDLTLLKRAREAAIEYLKKNPGLKGDDGEVLKKVLKTRWEGRLELAEIG